MTGLGDFAGWVHPVPAWYDSAGQLRTPVVSSGFRRPSRPSHNGVDIFYRRMPGEPDRGPGGSRGFYMPTGRWARAAGPGIVHSAEERFTREGGTRGMGVVIVHDDGRWSTFYNHGVRGTLQVETGDVVDAGAALFEIGGAPHQGPRALRHLHFELWRGTRQRGAVDPARYLERWTLLVELPAAAELPNTAAGAGEFSISETPQPDLSMPAQRAPPSREVGLLGLGALRP